MLSGNGSSFREAREPAPGLKVHLWGGSLGASPEFATHPPCAFWDPPDPEPAEFRLAGFRCHFHYDWKASRGPGPGRTGSALMKGSHWQKQAQRKCKSRTGAADTARAISHSDLHATNLNCTQEEQGAAVSFFPGAKIRDHPWFFSLLLFTSQWRALWAQVSEATVHLCSQNTAQIQTP